MSQNRGAVQGPTGAIVRTGRDSGLSDRGENSRRRLSKGVEKAEDQAELAEICKKLFRHSTLLLAQEFLYTEFDWRIGVLDNQPLYAPAAIFMVKDRTGRSIAMAAAPTQVASRRCQ